MFLFAEMTEMRAEQAFLVGMPEAMGLFVFGSVLIITVILLRRFMDRNDKERRGRSFAKKN